MTRTYLIVFLVVALVGVAGWAAYQKISGDDADIPGFSSPSPSPTMSEEQTSSATPTPGPVQTLEGGLQVQDLVVGDGEEAKSGMIVSVHYSGWLAEAAEDGSVTTGTMFDSSLERQPYSFTLGAGGVIRGWDVGVAGMKVGGTRVLLIPPSMGYGSQGAGDVIPPNATLLFQVQLLGVGK
jgi:FKBP-type peptidyl-prolyl cis-trans isomerase